MATNKLRFLVDTKKCKVIDTTDYENLNIPLVFVNAKLLGTIGGPAAAVVVKDSPSDPLVNLVLGNESAEFSLPLANGQILNGNYTLDTSLNISRSNLVTRTLSSSGVNTVSIIGIDLSGCFISGDTVTLSNSTLGNNGVKNITAVSWDGDDTILTVSETLVNESVNVVSAFDITRTSWFVGAYVYSGCTLATLDTKVTFDCNSGQFGNISFYDETTLPVGQTLDSRSWTISYPSQLNPAPATNPITSTDQNVFVNELATGPWTYRLVYGVTVAQTDDLEVVYTLDSGALTETVNCDGDICEILDCYKKLVDQVNNDINTNGASTFSGTLLVVNGYLELAANQKTCGDNDGFCATIATVKGLIEASGSCTCGCDGTEGNRWVNNAGFDSQTQIEAMAIEIEQLQSDMVTVQEQSAIALENSDQAVLTAEQAALQAGNAQTSANQAQLAADTAQAAADSKVQSVNGGIVDNTDPLNPLVYVSLDPDQFTGNGAFSNPISITQVDASLVNITPSIPGLTATDGQSAFEEIQTSKLETVSVDGTTITGNGTPSSPLVAAAAIPKVYVVSLTQTAGAVPADTVLANTTTATITWTKLSGGTFRFTADAPVFTAGKTILLTQASGSGNYIIIGGISSTTQGIILTGSSFGSSWSDNLLNGAIVKVEIYP